MGSITEFYGEFAFSTPLSIKLKNYINDFSGSRRMKGDVNKIKQLYPNWEKYCYNGELGVDGEYFARPSDNYGQNHDDSILDYNIPPKTQPSLWCDWIISQDGKYLIWDGNEKFYHYIEWLKYLIKNFFEPNGIFLNGEVEFYGDDAYNNGAIVVNNNEIEIIYGAIHFEDEP